MPRLHKRLTCITRPPPAEGGGGKSGAPGVKCEKDIAGSEGAAPSLTWECADRGGKLARACAGLFLVIIFA